MQYKELYKKLIISGPLIERLEFYHPQIIRRARKIERQKPEVADPEKFRSSVSRARSKVRRLIFVNFNAWKDKNGYAIPSKFLTLTFEKNIQDLKMANSHLTKFVQKINYTFKNNLAEPLKYICVPEFQKRGAVHYHLVLFNFPFIDKVFTRIRDLWLGRFELKTINKNQDVAYVANYLSKYITKQAIDLRFWSQKRFFASRELKQPNLIDNDIEVELISQFLEPYQKYKTIFNVPYCGDISYWSYFLGDGKDIYSLPFLTPYLKKQGFVLEDNNKKV